MRQFVEDHLEAPLGGTTESRKAVTRQVFAAFPEMEQMAKNMMRKKEAREAELAERRAEAAARGETIPEDETATTYHAAVDGPTSRAGR